MVAVRWYLRYGLSYRDVEELLAERCITVDLVHPAHPDAPTTEYPAPISLRVPRAQQRPMTIRPPSPSQARVRAARLPPR